MSEPDDRNERRGDRGFLERWSRRKAQARGEQLVEDQPPPASRPGDAAADPPARDEQRIGPPDLPDIDSLTAASDFKVFLQKGVPEELKTLALRKLWRLKPSLANLDGLLEYGGDYTRPAVGAAAVRTAYQIGRGYLKDEDAGDRQVQADAGAATSSGTNEDAPAAEPAQADAPAATTTCPSGDTAAEVVVPATRNSEPPVLAPHTGAEDPAAKPRRPLPRRT